MKVFFALLIIIFLAFSGYHLTFRKFRLPHFTRTFYLTGTEFLFLGLLLGPEFLNLFDAQTARGLEPLSALLLGWIGLLFGFQFEVSKLRRFPFEFLIAAVAEGLLTFIPVFLGAYLTLSFFQNIPETLKIIQSLALAAIAACTAQTSLAILAPGTDAQHRKLLTLLRYISSIDGLIAMLIFVLVFLFRPLWFAEASWTGELQWGIFIIIGACAGLLLYALFLSQRRPETELILVVIGMAVLISGLASVLNFSPLLSNFFIGFCLVNFSREKERIFNMLISVEKPVYLLILVLLGINWRFDSGWIFLLAAAYCLFRLLGKVLGGLTIKHLSPELKNHPSQLGFGLLDSGGLALAILLDFQQGFPCPITHQVISLALLSAIYCNLLSPVLLGRLLKADQ
ncbi:MAG: hypothetical protein JW786_10825 [Desulfobacterales bacterium]|nr:hypothetical protein [Desulfobacterales bacterium]